MTRFLRCTALCSLLLLLGCTGTDDSPPAPPPLPGEPAPPKIPDGPIAGDPQPAPPPAVTRLHPSKARFSPGEVVELVVEIYNPHEAAFAGDLKIELEHLGRFVLGEAHSVVIAPGDKQARTIEIPVPDRDYTGYLATVGFEGGEPVTTALDISSTALRYPRYGYVSDFGYDDGGPNADGMRWLAEELHVNLFQFYDWFWRHEKLLEQDSGAITDTWRDLFGRDQSREIVRDLIATAHEYNALALSYVMSYVAREGYAERWPIQPKWGLFEPNGEQAGVHFDFGPSLYLFDPGNSEWQRWMSQQYVEAVDAMGFDGFHIDQFGPRHGLRDGNGQAVNLPHAFARFLDAVKAKLLANDPSRAVCAFNLVDGAAAGWAVDDVAASSSCEFLFSELWYAADTYTDILSYVEYLKTRGSGRAVVLAGYSNYGEELGPVLEAEQDAALVGVGVASEHVGFSGTGFVDGFDAVGDSITWFLEGPEDLSKVTFVARFANATSTTATRNLYMDEQLVGELRFGPQQSWQHWSADASLQTLVTPGPHSIRIAFDEGNTGAVNVDHLRLGEFDEDTVRLENAVMFASGASHIQLGDDVQALAHEYYPNRTKSLTASLRRALERYYDFMTAYEELLFAPSLEMLGQADDSVEITTGQPLTAGEGGRVFTVERRSSDHHVLHLINLMGLDNERWRDAAPFPIFQRDVGVKYYLPDAAQVRAVWLASPDFDGGRARQLTFERGKDQRGDHLAFTVPRLEYWDMIFIERDGTAAP